MLGNKKYTNKQDEKNYTINNPAIKLLLTIYKSSGSLHTYFSLIKMLLKF